jgi:hypothetical protein
LVGANPSSGRHGDAAEGARTGLGEGIPKVPKLQSRVLKVFGTIEVAHHQFTPGEIETLPFKGPVVNLHLSAPHRLVQRQDGQSRGGLVATNDAAITPAGMPGYWRTDAASEDMSMLLEEGFIRRMAREADVDPGKIEIVPVFSAPDPQIERIGLSLLSEMETGGLMGGAISTPSRWRPCWRFTSSGTTPRWSAIRGGGSVAKADSPGGRSERPPIT